MSDPIIKIENANNSDSFRSSLESQQSRQLRGAPRRIKLKKQWTVSYGVTETPKTDSTLMDNIHEPTYEEKKKYLEESLSIIKKGGNGLEKKVELLRSLMQKTQLIEKIFEDKLK